MSLDFLGLPKAAQIAAIYVAYFGRAPDPVGRDFWVSEYDRGLSEGKTATQVIDDISESFRLGAEAETLFPFFDDPAAADRPAVEAFLIDVYQNLFNRQPGAAGLAFWADEVEARLDQGIKLGDILVDIISGAQDGATVTPPGGSEVTVNDAATVQNKIAIGNTYADQFAIAARNWSTPADLGSARAAVQQVGDNGASVAAGQAVVDAVTGVSDGIAVQGDVFNDAVGPLSDIGSATGALEIGRNGPGALTVVGAAGLEATSSGFDNVELGSAPDGAGTAIVSGAEASLIARGPDNVIHVGRVGSGTLLVGRGAEVRAAELEAAREGGRGEVIITGAGTQAVISTDTGLFSGDFVNEAGFVSAGRTAGSDGRIVVADSASMVVRPGVDDNTSGPAMILGREPGSHGEFLVDDATVAFTQDRPINEFEPFVNVGQGGEGLLEIRDTGRLTISGPTSGVNIGRFEDGAGTLFVTSGGLIESLFYNIGRGGGSTGTVEVKGQDSLLLAQGVGGPSSEDSGQGAFITVGRNGSGTLDVHDGASVRIESDEGAFPGFQVARNSGSEGRIDVAGDGSSISVESTGGMTPVFHVGRGGDGEMTIRDGATVEGAIFGTVGFDASGTGSLDVHGANSLLSLSGVGGPDSDFSGDGAFLNVGLSGTGALDVRDGGTVRIRTTNGEFVGFQAGRNEGSGTIRVAGDGSSIEVLGDGNVPSFQSGWAMVGRQGTGTLEITEGGQVIHQQNGIMAVGFLSGSEGTVSVTGTNSVLDAGSNLIIGAESEFESPFSPDQISFASGGTGTVTVANGGTIRAGAADNDGLDDIFIGAGGTLEVLDGGTLIGDVRTQGGTFVPGNSPGLAMVQGDFDHDGTLNLEFAGTGAGEHDRIEIAGTAVVDGELTLSFLDGFTPAAGQRFDVLAADQGLELGDDLSVDIVGLPAGLTAKLLTGTTDMQVAVAEADGALV